MKLIGIKQEIVVVQILYLFILPVLLIYFNVIPSNYRIVVFVAVALMLLGIINYNKWTFRDIGIIKKWHNFFLEYILFTTAGVLFLIWLAYLVPHEPFLHWWENKRFLLLFIPISILQEVIFRGVLLKMLLDASRNIMLVVFINAILFALMHMIYLNHVFILPLTFIGGIAFAWMYIKYKNLILISLSHTVLNFTAMILGFFVVK